MPDWEKASTARVMPPARPRKLAKVPFVELADGRLQGVVSSGSDIERVYVSSVAAGSYAFACSTNNNRPCGGARGSFCNHIRTLIDEAVLQYGAQRVVRYLRSSSPTKRRARRTSRMRWPARGRARGHLGRRSGLQPVPPPPGLPGTSPGHRAAAGAALVPADARARRRRTQPSRRRRGVMRADLLAEPIAGLDDALAAVDAFDRVLSPACSARSPPRPPGWRSSPTPSRGRRSPPGSPRRPGRRRPGSRARITSPPWPPPAPRCSAPSMTRCEPRSRRRPAAPRARTRPHRARRAAGRGPACRRPLLAVRPGALRLAGARPRRGRRVGAGHLRDAGRPGAAPAGHAARRLRRRTRRVLPGLGAEARPGAPLGRPVVAGDAADAARRGRPARAAPSTATGRLLPLGVDLHEHATAAQAQVHAVFEPADGGAPRLVRASVCAPKPDTVIGPASGSCSARTCRCSPPSARAARWTSRPCRSPPRAT